MNQRSLNRHPSGYNRGQYYEQQARAFSSNRAVVRQPQYRCRQGGGLIMRELQTLVFVEVRYRASRDYGGRYHQ